MGDSNGSIGQVVSLADCKSAVLTVEVRFLLLPRFEINLLGPYWQGSTAVNRDVVGSNPARRADGLWCNR